MRCWVLRCLVTWCSWCWASWCLVTMSVHNSFAIVLFHPPQFFPGFKYWKDRCWSGGLMHSRCSCVGVTPCVLCSVHCTGWVIINDPLRFFLTIIWAKNRNFKTKFYMPKGHLFLRKKLTICQISPMNVKRIKSYITFSVTGTDFDVLKTCYAVQRNKNDV